MFAAPAEGEREEEWIILRKEAGGVEDVDTINKKSQYDSAKWSVL